MITDALDKALQKADPRALEKILSCNDDDDRKLPPRKRFKGRLNEYTGWVVPSNGYSIPKVDANDLTPESFYKQYVHRRRPVILCGMLKSVTTATAATSSSSITTADDDGGDNKTRSSNNNNKNNNNNNTIGLENWTSNEYLTSKAGDELIMVEKRESTNDSFGRGNEIPMSFKAFINLISNGDDMHYLTTQDVEATTNDDDDDDDEGYGGRPDLMAPLMKKLQDDFVLRPTMMGNLIPQNINLWMGGNSRDGTSSGLHHDYHDNLYIVLRGKKTFRLYSPMDAESMYTRGVLVKVHPNGRINYEGEETTAYGADLKSDAAAKAALDKKQAEEMLIKAERDLAEGVQGAQERLELAEEAMDQALEALLEAEADDDENEEGEDGDDDDDEDNDGGGLFGSFNNDNNDTGDSDDEFFGKKNGRRRLVDKTVKNPDNFSRVEPALLDNKERLQQEFPKILSANVAFGTVEQGESLYLPASWFHEVTSSSDNSEGSKSSSNGSKSSSGHMAMNYWFHPPDAFDNFERPYSTDFWPNDFRKRFD